MHVLGVTYLSATGSGSTTRRRSGGGNAAGDGSLVTGAAVGAMEEDTLVSRRAGWNCGRAFRYEFVLAKVSSSSRWTRASSAAPGKGIRIDMAAVAAYCIASGSLGLGLGLRSGAFRFGIPPYVH